MELIYTKKKQILLVSECDFAYLNQFRWFVNKQGYAVRWSPMKNGRRHWIRMTHEIIPPNGYQIDHKDRNRLNNQRENLRRATSSQNGANSVIQTPSGYKGVYAHQGKWKATISNNNKKEYLGMFDSKEEAALAYNKKAQVYFGEFAHLNQI